jgi:hypothetical protein
MRTLGVAVGAILTVPALVIGLAIGLGYEPENPADAPQVIVVESAEHLLAVAEGVCRGRGMTWVAGKRDSLCMDVPSLGQGPRVSRRYK